MAPNNGSSSWRPGEKGRIPHAKSNLLSKTLSVSTAVKLKRRTLRLHGAGQALKSVCIVKLDSFLSRQEVAMSLISP